MSLTLVVNNRSVGWDNIKAGSVYGQELGESAPLANLEDISVGNPTPVNLERGVGATGIPASSQGLEIP